MVTKAFINGDYDTRRAADQADEAGRRYSAGASTGAGDASTTTAESGFVACVSAAGFGGFFGGGTDSRRVSAYSMT